MTDLFKYAAGKVERKDSNKAYVDIIINRADAVADPKYPQTVTVVVDIENGDSDADLQNKGLEEATKIHSKAKQKS